MLETISTMVEVNMETLWRWSSLSTIEKDKNYSENKIYSNRYQYCFYLIAMCLIEFQISFDNADLSFSGGS